MNFNTKTNEYKLQSNLTNELINLYGVQIKLILVDKVNKDDTVFGDYSHLKTNTNAAYNLYALPETADTWDNIGVNFSQFGLSNMETINLFISRKSIDKIFDNMNSGSGLGDIDSGNGFESIIGNLVTLPNGRIMEITEVQYEVPGSNNLFTQDNEKNVYKFSLKTYQIKQSSELDADTVGEEEYASLNNYFNELVGESSAIDEEAEVTEQIVVPVTDSVFDRF